MSNNRVFVRLLTMLVCLPISLLYIYNRHAADSWIVSAGGDADYAVHLTLIGMLVMLFFGVRATALLATKPGTWRSTGRLDNMESLYMFRDSRMKGMTNEAGSVLMRETQLLDGMMTQPEGSETHRVAEYINSRLAGMTYEQGLEFMKGKRK